MKTPVLIGLSLLAILSWVITATPLKPEGSERIAVKVQSVNAAGAVGTLWKEGNASTSKNKILEATDVIVMLTGVKGAAEGDFIEVYGKREGNWEGDGHTLPKWISAVVLKRK